MLSVLRHSRYTAIAAMVAVLAGLWLFCPCPPEAMVPAEAHGPTVGDDPHACCKTKPGIQAAGSCCPDDARVSRTMALPAGDAAPTGPPPATRVLGAPALTQGIRTPVEAPAGSFRPPRQDVLRI